jgi:hypothetical protein
MVHLTPTIIGFPVNAGVAAQTTGCSPERFERELRLVLVERNLSLFCASLATATNLLSSVITVWKGSPVGHNYRQNE